MTLRKSLAVIGLALMVSAPAYGEVKPIRFKNEQLSVVKRSADELKAHFAELTDRAATGTKHVIMQFEQPVTDELRAKLNAAGVTLADYLGSNAFFASVRRDHVNVNSLAAMPELHGVAEIQQIHKLHTELVFDVIRDWMVVGVKPDAVKSDDPNSESAEAAKDPTVGVYVKFHADISMETVARQTIHQHAGMIRSRIDDVHVMVVELPYSQIKPLADEDSVAWIEPPLPGMSELNAENRVITQANTVQAAPYSLNGSGVGVMVYDGGRVLTTHVDFQGRAQVGAGELACTGVSYHSTHVAGTIGGAGVAVANNKGMAPGVSIVSYGLNQNGGCSLSQGFLYTDPGDINADYGEAINTYGADLANNSIGTNTAPNGFPCSWEGDYGVTDTVIDAIARGSLNNGTPFRIVWANGNERQVSTCNDPNVPAGYHKTAPPACAKNHITVGALNANDDSMTSFSSWGPADDGRMKPDISAPGCQSNGDGGVTSCDSASNTAYTTLCGTSMASPTVCGLSALLLQDYRVQYPARPDFRASTLKILLAHTAIDLGNPGPDNQFGYGSVRIKDCIDFMRTGNFKEGSVSNGGVDTVFVVVGPTDNVLKITLAWDDPPGTPNVSPALVNDLDLVVFDPTNNQRFPWTLGGLANPSAPAVQTQKNAVDNIEQVYLASPPPGVYRVEVRGFNVPSGPQPFSLCASPLLVNCSDAGTIGLDRAKYPCSATSTITVVDCDLNTDDMVAETVNVTIASTTEPGGETVTLTETGPLTALFQGSISLSTTNSSGVLQIADGDTITATYVDADDGMGGFNVNVTSNAVVDCSPPEISHVTTSNIQARNATIEFATDESAKGTVRWGTSCGSLSNSVTEAGFATDHSIVISGLDPNSTYYYAVDAVDTAGNAATDDNGGACYSFMTPNIPELFTQIFPGDEAANDLDNKSILFYPDGGISHYKACTIACAALPTDPTGGTAITTWTGSADDGNSLVTLTGGQTVKLHNVSYGSFWVGTNGNLTFSSAETDYTETLAEHFSQPRISVLWDDLNPGQAGQVSYKQLVDRIAVTWLNVTEHNAGNANTCQIEMYFDGRITLSWLACASADNLVGLSQGGGLSPDFFESNLSNQTSGCGPLPPSASNGAVATPPNTWINVTLQGSDANMDPLTYIITALPPNGKLRDPATGTILSVPYTLALGGNIVRYTPNAGYLGVDTFQFKVNDGGSPPNGGDSNIATITATMSSAPAPIFSFPLDSNPGWTTQGQWAFGHPTGSGSHNFDPANGFTGTNVYGYNLAGDYPNNLTPTQYLTTTAINCAGQTGVQVRFRRWLGVESASFDHANLQVSNNGTTWVDVWSHTVAAAISENAWSLQTFNVSATADNQATVYLRWGMGTTDGSVTYPGWNIDDIEILANVSPVCASVLRGDTNFDTAINGGDVQKFVNVLLNPGGATQAEVCAADVVSDGVVNMLDLDEMVFLLMDNPVP